MIAVVITLILIGVALYLFETYATKIDPTIKKVVRWVVFICVGVWLLYTFGVLPMRDVPVPQVR